jgi:hypothetical protein
MSQVGAQAFAADREHGGEVVVSTYSEFLSNRINVQSSIHASFGATMTNLLQWSGRVAIEACRVPLEGWTFQGASQWKAFKMLTITQFFLSVFFLFAL